MTTPDRITALADYLTLAYHEGRNVRHLIKAGVLPPQPWRHLTTLPSNRDLAWRQMQVIRRRARSSESPASAVAVFEDHFGVSLEALMAMYQDPNWKHAKAYGGNAWAGITQLVLLLSQALERFDEAQADRLILELAAASHNTGKVAEKLRKLDAAFDES